MKTIKSMITRYSWLIILGVVSLSCDKEEGMMNDTEMKTQAEESARLSSEMVAASQDVMDITAGAMEENGISNGRYSSDRTTHRALDCRPLIAASFSLDRTHPDTLIYKGVLTIDYGDGSSCADSTEVRKGKIVDSLYYLIGYKDKIVYDKKESVTFVGFEKDSIKIDGNFSSHSTSEKITTLKVQNAHLSYPDGTTSSWEGMLTYTYHTGNTESKKSDDSKEVTGSISGTNREGVSFASTITQPVWFYFSCFKKVPVKGVIETTVGTATSKVDFGDGECDKIYTITTAGTTTEYKFHSRHSGK